MKKAFVILLAMLFIFPLRALAGGASPLEEEGTKQIFTYQGEFPAHTVVSIRVEAFYGIDLYTILDAIACMADGMPIGSFQRIGVSERYTYLEDDLVWFNPQGTGNYMLEFVLPDACQEISIIARENGNRFFLKDISFKITFLWDAFSYTSDADYDHDIFDTFNMDEPWSVAPSPTSPPLFDPLDLENQSYSDCEKALTQFLECWKAGTVADMVPLTAHTWRSKMDRFSVSPEQSLYAQISGKNLRSYIFEGEPGGTDEDTSRVISVVCDVIQKNEPRLYRYCALMLYEEGEWLVDPNSLMSGTRMDVTMPEPDDD